jgi:cell division septation protein DedD
MDPALKQRLVGAGVLVALAVIFLPMLVQGPAPDSGVADVPLAVPDAPQGGFETRDLPLVGPGVTPEGGAVGMQPAQQAAQALPQVEAPPPESEPLPSDSGEMYPAAIAGGDYAVSFGSFSTIAAADAAVASLRASQLPGFREAATIDGKTVQRVRIGPFASRADAEAARQRAAQAGSSSDTRVIALDDEPVATPVGTKPVETKPAAPKPVASVPAVSKPIASKPAPAVPKPAAPAAADVGFAVQLAAFSKPADAIALRDRARAAGFSAFTETVPTDKGNLVRVRIGPVASRAEAERLQAQVQAKLGLAGVVRSHP